MSFINKFGESTIKHKHNTNSITKEYIIKNMEEFSNKEEKKFNKIRNDIENIVRIHENDIKQLELNINHSIKYNNDKIINDHNQFSNEIMNKFDKITSDIEQTSNAVQKFIVNSSNIIKNQILNENKEYRNKNEQRLNQIEETIFKWVGMEELITQYTNQLNEIKNDLKILKEATLKNEKFIRNNESRINNIESYLFKSIELSKKN